MAQEKRTKEEIAEWKRQTAMIKKMHEDMLRAQDQIKEEDKIAPEGAYISLRNINKVYDNHVQAVFDFNLDIKKHELIVFVGPSGCGKSTTLRMIAGLESITTGDLFIDGVYCNEKTSKERDVAMVFQNYALYPHMTVYENMAFGLKIRHFTKEEIDERVRKAAEILQITEYLSRRPKELSGGQRQRVALGRAIVREAKVFLMDEPLSNLDAKLRVSMRSEIIKLHRQINATTIYVTHDQTEAMTMADRIVVMKAGHIQQIGAPREIYAHPANVFVATFIGSPAMNMMEGTYLKNKIKMDEESEVTLSKDFIDAIHSFYPNKISEFEKELQALEENFVERNEYLQKIEALKQELAHLEDKAKAKKEMELTHLQERLKECEENHSRRTYLLKALEVLKQVDVTKEVPMLFGIRPEGIIFKEDGPFSCVIETVELVGVEKLVHFTFKNEKMIAKVKNTKEIIEGETMYFDFDLKYFHIFDKETELTIL